jgi:branched-chain amino acid transport system permease protein
MENTLLALPQGIILGGAYGAIAVGLSVIFGVMRVINFAQGSMLMASCFLYYVLYENYGIDPYLGIIAVVPIMFLFGYVVQNFLVKPLIVRERASVIEPTSVMMMTIGLDFALMYLFMMIFGASYRTIKTTASGIVLKTDNGMFTTTLARPIALVAGLALALVLWFIFNKTELGTRIRAVAQNRTAAGLCGVDVFKSYSIAFGLGVAALAVSGACLIQFLYVQPNMGTMFGVKSFMIVVLGGLGSIPGALIGGIIFGVVETVGAQLITGTAATMLSFMLFIIVLVVKPTGLFGKK